MTAAKRLPHGDTHRMLLGATPKPKPADAAGEGRA